MRSVKPILCKELLRKSFKVKKLVWIPQKILAFSLLLYLAASSVSANQVLEFDFINDTKYPLTSTKLLDSPDQLKAFNTEFHTPFFMFNNQNNWWVRVKINATNEHYNYLLIERTFIQKPQIFSKTHGKIIELSAVSEQRYPIYSLGRIDENTTIYIRLINYNGRPTLPISLLTNETLLKKTNQDTLIYAALLSALLILTFYNILLFISLYEKSNLYLTIFIITCIILFIRDNNLFTSLTWLYDDTGYLYNTPLIIAGASVIKYWSYINKNHNKFLVFLCYWIPRLLLIAIPFIGLIPNASYWIYVTIIILEIAFFIIITRIAIQGHQVTRQYYLGFFCIVITTLGYFLERANFLNQNTFWTLLAQIGVVITFLFLSFMQGRQTRSLHKQKERIIAINQAKDHFLATISHELRTPMHAIMGINQILKLTSLNTEQQDYLTKSETAAQHMLSIIDELLELVSLSQSKIRIASNLFRVEQLLNELEQMFTAIAQQKGIKLLIERYPLGYQVEGDAKRLFQVLSNLVMNALKYTESGMVTVQTQVEHHTNGRCLLSFAVIDTGSGIATEHLPFLFEPFYKVKPTQSGVGLGLNISQNMVTAMGGQLKVESRLGQGSRFFFSLTLKTVPLENPLVLTYPTINPPLLPGIKVLLVDDDEINLFIGRKLLITLDVAVVVATNAEAALQQLQQQTFDLVFIDINMPQMNGYELTHQIRAQASWQKLPIIALTAHTFIGIKERCLAAGMNAFLGKPFTREELLNLIQIYCPHNPMFSSHRTSNNLANTRYAHSIQASGCSSKG